MLKNMLLYKMATIQLDKPLHPFIFVGCWNNPYNTLNEGVGAGEAGGAGAEVERIPAYKRVFDTINRDPVPTLILGGDNIYPLKVKGTKERSFNLGEIRKGFNSISKESKPTIFTTLGNHNIGEPDVTELIKKLYNVPEKTYYCVDFTDASILFLDTNIFKKAEKLTDPIYLEMMHFVGTTIDHLHALRKPYYVVGHYPIAGMRRDENYILRGKHMLLENLSKYPPIAILTSHLHIYQKGIIEYNPIKITQYIVGTGGAKPDEVPILEVDGIHIKDDTFNYTVEESKNPYGYLRFTSVGSPGEFIRVMDASVGGYRKTKRARRGKGKGKSKGQSKKTRSKKTRNNKRN